MPENARVFLAEDDKNLMKLERLYIEREGYHKVVLEASSLEEALEKVKLAEEKRVTVAVLDGSISGKPTDGPQIAEALRKAILEIKIVSFSGEPVSWGDENPMKPYGLGNLSKIISNL